MSKIRAEEFRGALAVEKVISGPTLFKIENTLLSVLGILGAGTAVVYIIASIKDLPFDGYPDTFLGFTLLAFALWVSAGLFASFYRAYYFADIDTVVLEPFWKLSGLKFGAGLVLCSGNDVIESFFKSRYGRMTALRLAISIPRLEQFLTRKKSVISPESLEFSEGDIFGLADLAKRISENTEVSDFLSQFAVSPKDFIGSARWVELSESRYKEGSRFWGRDALGRIPGIAKDWAYGEIPHLDKFTTPIENAGVFASSKGQYRKEVGDLERVLCREREANAMLVCEEGTGGLGVVSALYHLILSGSVMPQIEHKKIFVMKGSLFLKAFKDKNSFEQTLFKLLNEATSAGNVILVFDEFDAFYEEAGGLGSDALSLMTEYLESSALQIVAIANLSGYQRRLEHHPKVRSLFEKVTVAKGDLNESLSALFIEASRLEYKHRVFFTYQSVSKALSFADRYFFEGVMPDKAFDLLREMVPYVKSFGREYITSKDVEVVVTRKTGIAVGSAERGEKETLLKLESILGKRVVGQEEALTAIAGAMRRARSGVSSASRPMGSFLFLGPTGVGKTETTKALASAFFGDEKSIIRFDMSEYNTDGALERLIGDFESGRSGVLAEKVREKPYGVLLLDEFEKTSKNVHDLFLQILDEGFFTDAKGMRVNARNLIIIATSNAGSDLIWNMIKEKGALDQTEIVSTIINRGLFKPELLNRFDGVILFHPLDAGHLKEIAKIQLKKLAERLKEKGLDLDINEDLINYLVSVGQDPKFGARPMNRAIADKVEQVIAERLLKGELESGSKVVLTSADFLPGSIDKVA